MNALLALKKCVASSLYWSGMLTLRSRDLRDESIILLYHRVVSEESPLLQFIQPGMYVTTKTFEKHLKYLSQHYDIIPLEEVPTLQGKRKKCIITFDDGWADTYAHAYPLLKHYGIPATIFLPTNFIGSHQWLWSERICFYVHNASPDEVRWMSEAVTHAPYRTTPTTTPRRPPVRNKVERAEQLIAWLKTLNSDDLTSLMERIDHHLHHLYARLHTQRPWLTWEEVSAMSSHRISCGAHSHTHTILTTTTVERAKEEIATSKAMLAERTGKPVSLFSYPNGNYNDTIIGLLKDQGFTLAVTTRSGTIAQSENLFTLRRFSLHDDVTSTIPMLACKLTHRIPFF